LGLFERLGGIADPKRPNFHQERNEMEIIPFEFNKCKLRTVNNDGIVWFCAKDAAEMLGYANTSKAIGDHCKGVTKRYPLQTNGGTQEAVFIGEPDLWRLITRSHLPEAQKIEAWVMEDVLPSIRKTGGYRAPIADMTPQAFTMKAIAAMANNFIAIEKKIDRVADDFEALKNTAFLTSGDQERVQYAIRTKVAEAKARNPLINPDELLAFFNLQMKHLLGVATYADLPQCRLNEVLEALDKLRMPESLFNTKDER
jgi:prophage antirepressor-like protein